jgi:hypothetical protein
MLSPALAGQSIQLTSSNLVFNLPDLAPIEKY